MAQNPVVTITMEDGSVMKGELYPEIAPNTVNNFISLIKKGFYDGLIFHRVIEGFMLQGGDPNGTGMGGPGYSIKGEFAINGFQNDLPVNGDIRADGLAHVISDSLDIVLEYVCNQIIIRGMAVSGFDPGGFENEVRTFVKSTMQ